MEDISQNRKLSLGRDKKKKVFKVCGPQMLLLVRSTNKSRILNPNVLLSKKKVLKVYGPRMELLVRPTSKSRIQIASNLKGIDKSLEEIL